MTTPSSVTSANTSAAAHYFERTVGDPEHVYWVRAGTCSPEQPWHAYIGRVRLLLTAPYKHCKPCVSRTKSSIRTHTNTHTYTQTNKHTRTHVCLSHNQRGSEQICLQTHSTFITCHLYSSTMNKTSGGILNAGSALKMQRAPPTGF